VSIQLQSLRGHNLAWALVETGRLKAGQRAAVIGGGFAGLAAAAALGRKGVKVTLFERATSLLATQRDNRTRWIHPHIHEWPGPGSRRPTAGLPLLDWHAGLAADMAAEVLAAFEAEVARSRISLRTGARAALGEGPSVSGETFDAVVLALGVGVEKSFGALPLASYWSDVDIGTVHAGPPRHHLVTGIGEGGVIDTLYLRLAGFSHAELADQLAAMPGMASVETELLRIEAEIQGRSDVEANAHLHARHAALVVPPEVDALLRSRLRTDTRVTLNGPEAFALAPRADLFNRFLLSRLLRLGGLDYVAGAVEDVVAEGAGWSVRLAGGRVLSVDRVNVRHGTVPSLAAAFPDVWAAYAPVRRGLPHLTPRPAWPTGYFD
jgi:glycine/D-amino acid oxidase-like deaminating enzyme